MTDQPVVMVTGGAQGIGLATAVEFSQRGFAVVLIDIDQGALEEAKARIERKGAPCTIVCADVSNEADVCRAVQTVAHAYGRIDVVCNNAGVGAGGPLESLTLEDWNHVIGVNLTGTFLVSKHSVPYLEKQGGSIINIASTRALMSEANTEAYSASKGGVVALTHAMAVSLGSKGIRVNAISPGWIETAEWRKAADRHRPEHTDADQKQHPVGIVGDPMDIAHACVYLASEQSRFITGQNLVIDGGMSIKMIYV